MSSDKPKAATPIEHVIVLMLENRSFDHMLGSLSPELPGLDGVNDADPTRINKANGKKYAPSSGAVRVLPDRLDPMHEYPNVKKQIAGGNMNGFAQDLADSYPHAGSDDIQQVMSYFRPDELPALHRLARNFTVCNRWYASVPGPTWANRFFAHSGTSLGHLAMPSGLFNLHLHWYNQDTIYDRLSAKDISWKIYYGDVPQSLLLVHQLKPTNLANYHHLDHFFGDVADPNPDTFPAFAFIEPDYYSPSPNDDHPPHDVLAGDGLIARVYNALTANMELFKKSLLVIVWDEHGGFYDHVNPLNDPTIPPDYSSGEFGFDFKSYGVRVPNVLVSPWTNQAVVPANQVFDHTSILKFVIENWDLAPLGARISNARSIGTLLLTVPRDLGKVLEPIHAQSTLEPTGPNSSDSLNQNQSGLVAYSQYLGSMTDQDPVRLNERTGFMMTSARAQIDTACDHVDAFVKQGHDLAKVLEKPEVTKP